MGKLSVTEETYENIRYRLNRDIVGLGPLEPVMRDSANEDIHVIGPKECHVDHGTYGMLETTVDFGTPRGVRQLAAQHGRADRRPALRLRPHRRLYAPGRVAYQHHLLRRRVAEGLLAHDPAGRGGAAVDQPDHQLGTLSPELSAYLWLCLENEQTVFVVGETASGKTTTLNAILSYIPSDSKIYTAEDTAEVIPPHNTWQQLLTREGGGEGSSDVDMFDLVAAALRSRPDYIIVGEVRGAEGRMAFQAAQTGHPVMLTFHASDIVSMIQRFTSEPINVPRRSWTTPTWRCSRTG